MFGQWLDSALDLFIPKAYNYYVGRFRPLIPKSARYKGQLYIGDDQPCGFSQRFIRPSTSPCSTAHYTALGLPFCMYTTVLRSGRNFSYPCHS